MFLLKNLRVLFALVQILLTCLFHLISSVIVTPRYSTFSRTILFNVYKARMFWLVFSKVAPCCIGRLKPHTHEVLLYDQHLFFRGNKHSLISARMGHHDVGAELTEQKCITHEIMLKSHVRATIHLAGYSKNITKPLSS